MTTTTQLRIDDKSWAEYQDYPEFDPQAVGQIQQTPPEVNEYMLALGETPAPDAADEFRSPWFWLRLPNGDLVWGCFPCSDAYFMHEDIREA